MNRDDNEPQPRSRVVHVCQADEWTQAEIAELYEAHLNTVEKLWRQWRISGTVEVKPHGGGVVARLAGWQTSVPVMSRTLKALGLQRKKVAERCRTPSARSRASTPEVSNPLAKCSRDDLMFIEESGVRTNMTRLYGARRRAFVSPKPCLTGIGKCSRFWVC